MCFWVLQSKNPLIIIFSWFHGLSIHVHILPCFFLCLSRLFHQTFPSHIHAKWICGFYIESWKHFAFIVVRWSSLMNSILFGSNFSWEQISKNASIRQPSPCRLMSVTCQELWPIAAITCQVVCIYRIIAEIKVARQS